MRLLKQRSVHLANTIVLQIKNVKRFQWDIVLDKEDVYHQIQKRKMVMAKTVMGMVMEMVMGMVATVEMVAETAVEVMVVEVSNG